MSSNNAGLEELWSAFRGTRISTYSKSTAIAALVYDIALNFGDEVRFIWRSPWSWPKVLYFISRYYAPIYLGVTLGFEIAEGLSELSCQAWLWINSIGGIVVVVPVTNTILVLRIHAIYGRNIKVLIFLVVPTVLQCLLAIVTSIWTAIKSVNIAPPLPQWLGCVVTPANTYITLLDWIPSIFSNTVYLCMMIHRFVFNSQANARDQMKFRTVSPLLQTFIKDGTLHFLYICGLALSSVLRTQTHRLHVLAFEVATAILVVQNRQAYPLPWLIAVYSLAGTKMVLNLRIVGDSLTSRPPSTHRGCTGYPSRLPPPYFISPPPPPEDSFEMRVLSPHASQH